MRRATARGWVGACSPPSARLRGACAGALRGGPLDARRYSPAVKWGVLDTGRAVFTTNVWIHDTSTRVTCRAVHSFGFAGGEVVRKNRLLAALLLGIALALSPAVAYASPTGGTTTGDNPAQTGGGGGHDTEDNPLWESVAKFVDGSVGNFNAWLNGLSNGWQDIQNGFWGSWGGSIDDGNEPEPEPENGVTEIAKTYVLDRTYFFNGSSAPTPADDKFNVTNVNLNDTMAAKLESLRSQYPYMLVYADYRKSDNKGSAYVCLSANPWRLGNPDAGEAKVFYTSGENFKYLYSNSTTYGSTTDIAITSGTIYTESKDSNTGVLRRFVPNNYSAMYRIFGSNNPSGGNPAQNPTSGGGGSGGNPSGGGDDGGGGGSSVVGTDPYGYDANEYTTTTVYNNLDLDLSPITKRLDSMAITNNQIGKDLNKLVYGIDGDLLRIFQAILLDVSTNRSNGTILQRILDELTDGYIKDIQGDIDQISKELINLQSNDSMQSVKGFLYTINKNVKDILQELESLPSGDAGGSADVDLTAVTDELEDFHLDAISAWDEMVSRLDTIIDDIEHLNRWQPSTPKPEPPSDLEKALGVDALKDALNRLMGKFPFSTINNLVLILTALVRPAVAPAFDLPMPNPSDWSSPYMVHVDLSEWSQVAAMMRVGILLWAIGRVSRRTVNLWTSEEGGGE